MKLLWVMNPPGTIAEMTCIPVHKTWQMNLLWPMDTHPHPSSTRVTLEMNTNLADQPSSINGPPGKRAEITCIPFHKTWQINVLWLMDPTRDQSSDALITTTQNLADYPPLANGLPWVPKPRWPAYHHTKLGRWTYFGQWTPWYQRREDVHTITQNMADESTLANGPPTTRVVMTCIPLHRTWQMKLLLA